MKISPILLNRYININSLSSAVDEDQTDTGEYQGELLFKSMFS